MYGLYNPVQQENVYKQSQNCIETHAKRNNMVLNRKTQQKCIENHATCRKLTTSIFMPLICCSTGLHSCISSSIANVRTIINAENDLGLHANPSPKDACQTPFIVALPPSKNSLLGIVPLHLPFKSPKKVHPLSPS